MLPFSALQAANYQQALAAQMQAAAAVAQHYTSLSASQVNNMSPSIVNSMAGQQHHGGQVTGMNTYTHPSGAVYATAPGLTQAQAQALQAMGHHHQMHQHQHQMVSSVPGMALSPSMACSVNLSHPNTSMQKLLSLPPPKVGPFLQIYLFI